MVLRYLEMSSIYRSRLQYPNPAEFVAVLGTSGADNTAVDTPYLPAFPIYRFFVDNVFQYVTPISGTTPWAPQVVIPAVGTLYGPPFDLSGFVVTDVNVDPTFANPSAVVNIDYPNGILDLFFPFDYAMSVGDTMAFIDYTPYSVAGPTSLGKVFYNIKSRGLSEERPNLTSTYYVGYYLMWDSAPPGVISAEPIIKVFPSIKTVQVQNELAAPAVLPGEYFSIRKEIPQARGAAVLPTPPANMTEIQLDAFAGSIDDKWVGSYLYIYPLGSDPIDPNYEENKLTFPLYVFEIAAYNGTTNVVTVTRAVSRVDMPLGNRTYEILGRPLEGSSTLQYAGTTVALSEPRCMEVNLVTLVLPNVPLKTGSQIAFYPYVYVELRAQSSSKAVGKNILTSNNPNSAAAIFVCPINDIARPEETPFIKLNSGGMTQTIKAKINDTFYFRVYLPDGRLFQPAQDDNPPPLEANPALQVNALFAFKD